jgi:hypothetical protein
VEEILKYRDLLIMLDQLSAPAFQAAPDGASVPAAEAMDEEEEEWAALIMGADKNLLKTARLRTCRSGLAAVGQYIATRELS